MTEAEGMPDAPGARPSVAPTLAVCVPAILILALLPFVELGGGTSIPAAFLFLGRLHPTLLHLPVAFLLLAALLMAMRLPGLRRFAIPLPDAALDLVVWLAALSGFATALMGWLLAHEGGYDAALLGRHLRGGVVTAIAALACVLLRSLAKARPDRGVLARLAGAVLVAACGSMIFAAHAGGSLTHGEDFLTEYAPAVVRRAMGLHVPRDRSSEPLVAIGERQAFDGVALRVFERHCTECHNAGKLKGGLRLDTHAGTLQGGQSGPVIVAGDPGSSEVLRRLALPVDDKKHMPPKGKEQPGPDAIAVLTWWIAAGAPDTDTLRALHAPPELRGAFSRILPEPERRAVEELQQRLAAEYEAALAGVRGTLPGSLRPITPGERDLEFTAAIAGPSFGDAELRKLEEVGADLVWLDLSRTAVTAAGLRALATMPNLQRLDLRDTSVGDDAVPALAGLRSLETLGLYGTRVSDTGVVPLAALPALRQLYVGGTSVTEAGRDALCGARAELVVTP